jgi:hypothetical protein
MIQLARDFAQDPSEINQKMIIASTRAEARLLNEQTREELKNAGKIEGDTLGMFENEDGDTLEMSKGDRIIFKKNSHSRGIVNNLRGTVLECRQVGENSVLKIQCDDGKTREINTQEYRDLRHGYAVTGHASQGATIQKSFVLFNRGASDLSWGYVAMTRHKDRVQLYATEADRHDLAERFSKAALKGTTLDLKEYQQATPEASKDMDGSAPSPQASSAKGGQQSTSEQMPQEATQQAGWNQQNTTSPKINWQALEQASPTLSQFLKISLQSSNKEGAVILEAIAASAAKACEAWQAEAESQNRQSGHGQRQSAELEM